MILTGKAKFWKVLTYDNVGHTVMQFGNAYIDNWERGFTSRVSMEIKHKHVFLGRYSRVIVLYNLLVGKVGKVAAFLGLWAVMCAIVVVGLYL